MANKFYNKQTSPAKQTENGWNTKANSTYSYGKGNGAGAYDRSGSPMDKRGSDGARNGAERKGKMGEQFKEAFRRKNSV